MIPALFTSTSTGPNSASAWSKSLLTADASATSAPIAIARPPAALMTATTSSASAALEAKLTTVRKPSAASRLATAAPMPFEAPVTIAVRISFDMSRPPRGSRTKESP